MAQLFPSYAIVKEQSEYFKVTPMKNINILLDIWKEKRDNREQFEERLRLLLYELLMKVSSKVSVFEKQVNITCKFTSTVHIPFIMVVYV